MPYVIMASECPVNLVLWIKLCKIFSIFYISLLDYIKYAVDL